MSGIIRYPTEGLTKPPYGAQLDLNWAGPHTDYRRLGDVLVFYASLNEGAGPNAWAQSPQGNRLFALMNAPTWGIERIAFNGTTSYLANTDVVIPSSGVTVIHRAIPGPQAEVGCAFGNTDVENVAPADYAYRCQAHYPFSGTVYWDFGGASSPHRVNYTPSAMFWGVPHTMVFAAGSTGMQIYEDGALKANSATAVTRSNRSAGFYIGRFQTTYSAEQVYFTAMLNIPLSAKAAAAWAKQPYPPEMWLPTVQRRLYMPASGFPYAMSLSEPIDLSDARRLSSGKMLSEPVGISDAVLRQVGKRLSDTLALSDATKRGIGRNIAEALVFTDGRAAASARKLTEALGLADALQALLNSGGTAWAKSLTEAFALADATKRQSGKALTEALALSDAAIRGAAKALVEVVPLLDARTMALAKSIGQALGIADTALAGIVGLSVLITVVAKMAGDGARFGGGLMDEGCTPPPDTKQGGGQA